MKKIGKVFLISLLCSSMVVVPNYKIMAQENNQITDIDAVGKSSLEHDASLAIDGNKDTYYLTPSSSSMADHYRNIDLNLDGIYELSKIVIYNNEGSYNHYQIYVSKDGVNYDKVAYKSNDKLANASGDEYLINVNASHVRINLSYNSKQLEGNLAEVELYGTKVSDLKDNKAKINVKDFEETKWAEEYQRFANDEEYANSKTIKEISDLVGRVIGENWKDSFIFEMRESNDEKDIFEIENSADGKIIIRGNNGVAMASGFNHYLKNYCKIDYDPLFASNLEMPSILPTLETKIVKETQYDYRYALNYCTYSYTMAFWSWDEYERFLDWAAMSGINTMLDIVGQEEVVRRTLSKFGYSDDEIKEYIAGPGYFAWFYMQNMTSYGGALPDNWFSERVELGRKMHDRMQTFGITPVLSGFSGQVPTSFITKHPDAQVVVQGNWCGYRRPDMLKTYVNEDQENYFDKLADVFYKAQTDLYGDVTNMYSVDPFHEGGKMGDMNATKVYETIQKKMMQHDKDAVWLIQEWSGSIANNLSKLKNLDKNHVVVLDLFSEISPRNSKLEEAETPWIWNMLHNFGGRMGLDGNPETISQKVSETYSNSKYMRGIGMTPEAIENSPMVYELMFENTWTKDPINYREWIEDYAERRYGSINDDIKSIWEILLNTAYATKKGYYQGAAESIFNARPTTNFTSASTWGHSNIDYDKQELEKTIPLFIKNYEKYKNSSAFIYDFSDVLKQVISNSAVECYYSMVDAYNKKDIVLFKDTSSKFLQMMELQEKVLSTNTDFLVGNWIEDSRNMLSGADDWTKDLFEYNARSLITTWGSQQACQSGLKDYSNRQWSGLTKDYYYPRWEMVINDTIKAMESGASLPNWSSYNWFLIESEWSTKKSDEGFNYPIKVSNESLQILAEDVMKNYTISALEDSIGSVETKQNIALGKSVVVEGIGTAQGNTVKNLTDGKKDTSWLASNHADKFTMTLDLESLTSVNGIEIAVEQIPEPKPYRFTIEVHGEDGKWKEISRQDEFGIVGNAIINYKGIADQVRFNFETNDPNEIPEIYELQVFGIADSLITYENIGLHNKVILDEGSKAAGTEATLSKITDGNPSTFWSSDNGLYPANLTLNLDNPEYVEYIELYFHKPGLGFEYEVTYENSLGQTKVLQEYSDDDKILLDQMYKLYVNDTVSKVHVNIKGFHSTPVAPKAWAALAEIKLMQPQEKVINSQNITAGKAGIIYNEKEKRVTTKLTNGNYKDLESANSDTYPTTYEIDLGRDEDINNIAVFFEKAGIYFQYLVEVENEEGSKVTVLDMTQNKNPLDESYKINTDVRGRYIRVKITGKVKGGQWPALSEIEAFSKPKDVVSDAKINSSIKDLNEEDKNALVDGNINSVVDLSKYNDENKSFTFILNDKIDIYAFELMNGKVEQAIQYKVEVKDSDGKWICIDDRSNNVQAVNKYMKEINPVLTNEVRLTIYTKNANIADFHIYQYDASVDLMAIISSLNSILSETPIGEYAGNYTQEAKDKLDVKIKKAQDTALVGINSEEAANEVNKLKAAYQEFLKSYVSIDRTALLVELTETKELLQLQSLKDNQVLIEVYTSAKTVYDTYKVTQNELYTSTEALKIAKDDALLLISKQEIYQEKLAKAKDLMENTEIGEYAGNVCEETMNVFRDTINSIEDAYLQAYTSDVLDVIIDDLTSAINNFKNAIIVVDKTALGDAIEQAEKLNQNEYTKGSWQEMQKVLDNAKVIFETEKVTVNQVEEAKNNLLNAIDNLVKITVDKTALKIAVDKANEITDKDLENVVPVVVKEFKAALQEANDVYADASATQEQVNNAFDRLASAMQKLEFFKGDKKALEAFVKKVSTLEKDKYTEATWEAFEATLSEANDVLANVNALETEVNEAYDTLVRAFLDLRLKPNKDLLNDLISKANGLNRASFTAASLSIVDAEVEKANAVLNDPNATEEAVNNAVNGLTRAIAGLEANPVDPEIPVDNSSAVTPVKPGDTTVSAIKTGDTVNITGMLGLLVMSGLIISRKKRK